MRFAFLIAAHDKPAQLELLIRRLLRDDTDDFVVLHLDAKSDLYLKKADHFANLHPGRIFLVRKPVAVYWGEPSQVTAAKLMLELALKQGFTFAHHISGVDWPVTLRSAMVDTIHREGVDVFAEIRGPEQPERMNDYWFSDKFIRRSQNEFFRYHGQRFFDRNVARFNRICRAIAPRREPFGPWQKGSSWWSVSPAAARRLVQEIEGLTQKGRLRFTACSDEHVVQTIFAHLFSDSLTDYRRYIAWEGGDHPRTLTKADVPAIRQSDAWFARKVDMEKDDAVIRAFAEF